jgi:hypothetical protein
MALRIGADLRGAAETLMQQANGLNIQQEGAIAELSRIHLQISALAKKALATDLPEDERRRILGCLTLAKCMASPNFEARIPNRLLLLNLTQPVTPSLSCPAYDRVQMPTFSTYGIICEHEAGFRLDPESSWAEIPASVRNAAVGYSPDNTDVLFSVINASAIRGHTAHYIGNVCFHQWAYPHLKPGADVKKDVQMGMFPLMGVSPAIGDPGGIAFNRLSPMLVHCHGGRMPKYMLYSPNNAHFRIDPDYPFFSCWIVGQVDGRTCINKVIGFMNTPDPLCKIIRHSIRDCPNLFDHMMRIEDGVNQYIAETLEPIAKELDEDETATLDHFTALPQWMKNQVYRQAWLLKGSPIGIHGDFGRMSFENREIDAAHFCSRKEQAQAIRQFAADLKDLLVDSQFRLYANRLDKGDNVETLMTISSLFLDGRTEEALALFSGLKELDKDGVFKAIWELNQCPLDKGPHFGEDQFKACSNEERSQAILLYASRCKHEFKPAAASQKEVEPLTEAALEGTEPSTILPPTGGAGEPVTDTSLPRMESLPTTPYAGFLALVANLMGSEKTQGEIQGEISAALARLDPRFQNLLLFKIYEQLFPRSGEKEPATQRGKLEWARAHTYNLTALYNAIEQQAPTFVSSYIQGDARNRLCGAVWDVECETKGRPNTTDSKWAEHNLFGDIKRLLLALDRLTI